MFCSKEFRCIFVHTPKTGGTSIHRTFRQLLPAEETFGPAKIDIGLDPRRFAWETKQKFATDQQWNDYFKFAYVRNPWDLVVSIYHNIVQSARSRNLAEVNEDKRIVRQQLLKYFERRSRRVSFAGFVDLCIVNDAISSRFSYHWRPQYLHVTGPDNQPILDFIGRFENFEADWKFIERQIGLSVRLPRLNRSTHLHYRDYYTANLRKAVARRFEIDVDMFGYRFD